MTLVRLLCAAAIAGFAALPAAADRQEGYYYPPVTSEEEFSRSLISGPPADQGAREAFVVLINKALLEAPDNPMFSLFAKGKDSRRLIMVGLEDEPFRTLFRARGVLAQLTYNLRGTAFFVEQGLETEATFYDLLQMLDFESLTVTNGLDWTHRVYFK